MTLIRFVYLLSFLTSLGCWALLIRTYRATGTRLLMWSALCFAFLALNNLLVLIDVILLPELSLLWLRQGAALLAVTALVWGFVSEAE